MIESIAWAVQPGSKKSTRPQRLVSELINLGVIGEPEYFYHGRTAQSPGFHRSPSLRPSQALRKSDSVGILSPLFLAGGLGRSQWVDLYDDWSIAPDIHPMFRVIAHRGYTALSKRQSKPALVTANSPYMANKVGGAVKIVPNGTEQDHWKVKAVGTEETRLIILGNFFPGRTDYDLITRVVRSGAFREVVFGGIGNNERIRVIIESLSLTSNVNICVEDWITADHLMTLVGPRTVALIPHLINDYTLSQDLMKAYTFTGLGIPVICPRLLWPHSIPSDDAYLVGHGDRMETHLKYWVARGPSSTSGSRRDFCNENSWEARARLIAEELN